MAAPPGAGEQREETVRKSVSEPSIADLAAQSAQRRSASSPQAKQLVRESRRLALVATLITGSSLICLWLLLA
jgi:hypothetical protein